jgi:hypothetical protein
MSKQWKSGRATVQLKPAARPSRIRRDPVRADQARSQIGRIDWHSPEWEVRLALAGMTFFALALTALVVDLGEILSH